jgi:hypothetical protein
MPKISSIPSKLIYSVDVPEVENFQAQFVYNYYVPNESIQDYKDDKFGESILLDKMNLNLDVLKQPGYEIEGFLNKNSRISDLKKLPRYIKLTWANDFKLLSKSKYGFFYKDKVNNEIKGKGLTDSDISKIVREDQFASSYYTSIESSNRNIINGISSVFDSIDNTLLKDPDLRNNFPKSVKEVNTVYKDSEADNTIQASMSAIAYQKGGLELKNQTKDSYLQKLSSTKFYSQINNNFLHSVVINALSSQHPNNSIFQSFIDYSKKINKLNINRKLSDSEYKASIPYHTTYQWDARSNLDNESTFNVTGYVIEKVEMFSDGTVKRFNPIVIRGGEKNSYIDFQVRYGAMYFYSIRTIMDITYNAIDNKEYKFMRVGSFIASKDTTIDVQTIENVAPPPPQDLMFVWNYDRVNQNTIVFDHQNNKPFPNTGVPGSLMIAWSMPVNSQMDIKKFQVFRRKSVNDPFELIKMYDFDDSISKFETLENNINPTLITKSKDPVLYYFDDDFYKNSEYIYAVASIDAHGLTSNYSEQFMLKFNMFSNKIEKILVSIAGAPKQYPNMYLERDLFVDTIKTSNKNSMHVYLNPDCIKVNNEDNTSYSVLQMKDLSNSSDNSKYCINIINTDVQKSRQLNINITKKVS